MPKPSTKEQLLFEIDKEHKALEKFLASLTPELTNRPGAIASWSIKDVLAHLFAWEQIFLGWYSAGSHGETPHLPAEGYNWGQLDQLNQEIYEKYQHYTLEEVGEKFQASHRQILTAVEGMSDEELFIPGRYAWTRKNSLAAYVIPCTSEHYQWARREMRKGLKLGKN